MSASSAKQNEGTRGFTGASLPSFSFAVLHGGTDTCPRASTHPHSYSENTKFDVVYGNARVEQGGVIAIPAIAQPSSPQAWFNAVAKRM